ncbi:MAG: DASH family cryptochrome [Burkholderiaceae bacterium]|nr:DASH family cryptochrome [Burkholderiaceae bacterium]MCD8517524.1 DASH family cryptochrome [Burkholderiaceae bacterium]MCD8565897.1 DASH family cryptochrome [Burkholderiaceae bacterium]
MTIIYWFRRDRRLSDNPALLHAITLANELGNALLPVTLNEDNPQTAWGFPRIGPHRLAFEAQSLAGLQTSLKALGSNLYQPIKPGVAGLIELATQTQASTVVCEAIYAPQELDEITQLQNAGIDVIAIEQSTMLPREDLPFDIHKTPVVFSEFRRAVEKAKCLPRRPLATPTSLLPLPANILAASPYFGSTDDLTSDLPALDTRSTFPYQANGWHGDETTAQAHLTHYFSSKLPQQYKETRNGLIGKDYSTKFSPWLAVGSLSAPQIWEALQTHEATHGSNDSTYWIWFELLWRDHFRLMMQRFGRMFFVRSGLAKEPMPIRAHNAQGFSRWRTGNTGNAFIDAAMRELAVTGYLSNRMRQNVASYLIHDLGGDWLAGAAWFEHCLIDFDVHSNQGNWAYIAGVGTDPRGGRRFNPEKQAHDYDRDATYRQLWNTP